MTKRSSAPRPPERRLQKALEDAQFFASEARDIVHDFAAKGYHEVEPAWQATKWARKVLGVAITAYNEIRGELDVLKAERARWQVFARTCAEITFISGAGHTVAVPEPLARQLALDEGLAAGITEKTDTLVFTRGKRVWCEMPKSLAVSLRTILQGFKWAAPPPAA